MDIEESFRMDVEENSMAYRPKEPETYKEIVLRAIEKCRQEMSKELTKGKTIFIERGGASIPVTIPDQRKVVENSVKQLYDLLLYFFDDIAVEKLKDLDETIDKLNQKYYEMYIELEKNVPHKNWAIANLGISNSPLGNNLMQDKQDERVKLYRTMYQELILLFKRKGDLSGRRVAKTGVE